MALKLAKDWKEDRAAAMLNRLLQYPTSYIFREKFMEFCAKKIVFTGQDKDRVFRKDFNEECDKFCTLSLPRRKDMEQHLVAAGVRVVRVNRLGAREYCYVGLRLADGEGRRFAAFMNRERPSDGAQSSDAAIRDEKQRATATTRPIATTTVSSSSQAPSEREKQDTKTSLRNRGRRGGATQGGGAVIRREKQRKPTISPSPQAAQNISDPPQCLPLHPATPSSAPQTPDGTIQDNAALQKFLNYRVQYKERDAFIRFCRANVKFTSDPTDYVSRKDLRHEFTKFLGGKSFSAVSVGMHLASAGMQVARHNKEYGYRGMQFLDGPGVKLATPGRPKPSRSHGGSKQDSVQTGGKAGRRLIGASSDQPKNLRASTSTAKNHSGQPHPASVRSPSSSSASVPAAPGTSTPVPAPAPSPAFKPDSSTVPVPSPVSTPGLPFAPVLLYAPVPRPAASDPSFSSTNAPVPTLAPATAPAPDVLNLSTSSAPPADLSISALPPTSKSHQPQYRWILPVPPGPQLSPTSFPAHINLQPPPPAHSKTQAPTSTLLLVPAQPTPQPTASSSNAPQITYSLPPFPVYCLPLPKQ